MTSTAARELVSLARLIEERGPLARSDAHRILSQLFAELAAAHARGAVHGSLTPPHVLIRVQQDGTALELREGFEVSGPASVTGRSLAPDGRAQGTRDVGADVPGLALLSLFVLSGEASVAGSHGHASQAQPLMSGAEASELCRPFQARGLLPPRFDGWLARCTTRDRGRRYADAGQAWTGLAPLLAGWTDVDPRSSERPSVVVRPGLFLTLVIMGCVLMGLAIYGLLRSMRI